MESSNLSPRVTRRPSLSGSNGQEIKEIIKKNKIMSVSGKRMCQLDKNISDEIYKISKRDPAEIRAKQGGDEADETDGKRSNLFKKPPGTKQSIKDILKRINDKNLKGLHHDMHKVVHKQPEVVQVSDFIIAKKDFSKNDLL